MFERGNIWVKFSQILLAGHQHQRKYWLNIGLNFSLCSYFTSILSNTWTNLQLILTPCSVWFCEFQDYSFISTLVAKLWESYAVCIACSSHTFPMYTGGRQLWILFTDLLNKWIWGRSLISLMIVLLKSLCKELAVDSNDRGCSQIMASPASSYLVSLWSLLWFFEAFIYLFR